MFYICMAGGSQHPCGTAIQSHSWRRLHVDPLATGQRWYCAKCGGGYKTKMGLLVEICHKGNWYYWHMAFPDPKAWDAKFDLIEQAFSKDATKAPKTPEALYDWLVKHNPTPSTETLLTKPPFDGHFSLGATALAEMPVLAWSQLLQMCGHLA